MSLTHSTAKPSHYNNDAQHYDQFNEKRSETINKIISSIFKKHAIKTALDLTCGTGSQVFYLTKHGYTVIGSDINAKMLKIAKDKAHKIKQKIQFIKADMRTAQLGQFDAVITIFNAIGHLTKQDFSKTLRNINHNLQTKGLYIFDIFNLDYFLHDDNIVKLTIDWQTINQNTKARLIQYSTIDEDGILASYTILHEQQNSQKAKIKRSMQTLQIYRLDELKNLLEQNGFKILETTNVDGSKFDQLKSERILIIAQKIAQI